MYSLTHNNFCSGICKRLLTLFKGIDSRQKQLRFIRESEELVKSSQVCSDLAVDNRSHSVI